MNNHKEKQNEILKEIEYKETDIENSKVGFSEKEQEEFKKELSELKQKANEHQAEVMKGCGNKVDYNGDCAYISSQGNLRLCSTCKKIIDKYEEVGI